VESASLQMYLAKNLTSLETTCVHYAKLSRNSFSKPILTPFSIFVLLHLFLFPFSFLSFSSLLFFLFSFFFFFFFFFFLAGNWRLLISLLSNH